MGNGFRLDLVVGARPNVMKVGPIWGALDGHTGIATEIIHTGQHYDRTMDAVFFEELGLPDPSANLSVGSGDHGWQTARILELYERRLLNGGVDGTVVVGDVNSTLAVALAAAKVGVPVVHVEAGLRSFDRTMPEEINRIVTDTISGLLLVSEPSGLDNLRREGIAEASVRYVGNVMIDVLKNHLPKAHKLHAWEEYGLQAGEYGLVTMHRASNVDDPQTLRGMLEVLSDLSADLPLVFPMHPRTREAIKRADLNFIVDGRDGGGLIAIGPQPYERNLSLMNSARVVLTDSGGMQEETTVLGVPCLTLRENTERPITTELGTSRLVGNSRERITDAFRDVLEGRWPEPRPIPLWDGRAGERIADEIQRFVLG